MVGRPAENDQLSGESGLALLLALIALSMFSLLGLYVVINSTTEVIVSDNFESEVHARYAAMAGLNHARALLRGLDYSSLLKGPDGTYDHSSAYLTQARAFSFRNPLPWARARSLNILDPADDVSGMADDGLICAPLLGLIPQSGIAMTVPDPYGAGTVTISRYFVKVSDNNGEATELAGDSGNNPFQDGDGIIIVRSMGVARTIGEKVGSGMRLNSVVVFEARFRMGGPFCNLGSPVVVLGSAVEATFTGSAFAITGGLGGPGIATVDTNIADSYDPDVILAAATGGRGSITGICAKSDSDYNTCIRDVTTAFSTDPQKQRLQDAAWLYDFVFKRVPGFADNIWDGVSQIDLGTSANPMVTFVNGNLSLTGNVNGVGLLVVSGDLILGGSLSWDGLVLAVGSGRVSIQGLNLGIHGGMLVANLSVIGGKAAFGIPSLQIRDSGHIASYDSALLRMAAGLIPPSQLSFREVTSTMDPP